MDEVSGRAITEWLKDENLWVYAGMQLTAGYPLITMPCGETLGQGDVIEERKCKLSGNCPKGHKECWIVRIAPAVP